MKRTCRYLLLARCLFLAWTAAGAVAVSAQQAPTMAAQPVQALTPDEAEPSAQLPAAETDLRMQLGQTPGSAELLYRLALVLREERKPRESLTVYTEAAQRRQPTAEELRSVALDYVQLSDYEDAVHWLNTALKIDPRNTAVIYSLGRCLYTQDYFQQAADAFLEELKIAPDDRKAEENLGLTWQAMFRYPEAEAALRKAVEWTEHDAATDKASDAASDPWPYLNLGSFLIDRQREAEAIPFLEKAQAVAPQMAAVHEKLGVALLATGRNAEGRKELETSEVLDPKVVRVHYALGRLYWSAGEKEKAKAEFALCQTLYGTKSTKN